MHQPVSSSQWCIEAEGDEELEVAPEKYTMLRCMIKLDWFWYYIIMTRWINQLWPWLSTAKYEQHDWKVFHDMMKSFPPATTKEEAMVIKHLKCKYNYTNANEKIYKYKYTEKQITILRWYDLPTQRPRKKQWWSRM